MLAGVPLERREELELPELWWRARSLLLCAGCERAVPGFRFAPLGEPPPAPGPPERALLGFETGEEMRRWAHAAGARLLASEPGLTRCLADKARLGAIADRAGVPRPPSLVLAAARASDAASAWAALGEVPVMAQLTSDGLTGRGTRPARTREELGAILGAWAGRAVKVSRLLEGTPLSASGCVGADRAVVAGISRQLVGHPALTPHPASHCGNQLVADHELPGGVAVAARAVAAAIGENLRAMGFRGVFGVDLVAAGDGVNVVELNPRIHGLTALLGPAQLAAGLVPLPALQPAAFGRRPLPPTAEAPLPEPTFSQLFVQATAPCVARRPLAQGTYALAHGGIARVSESTDLDGLGTDEAVIWPFAAAGSALAPGERLAVIQLRAPVLASIDGGELTPRAREWHRALARGLELEAR